MLDAETWGAIARSLGFLIAVALLVPVALSTLVGAMRLLTRAIVRAVSHHVPH